MLKQFNSNAKKLNRIIPKINFNNPSSLLNDATLDQNPIKLVNNKNKIESFHNEILQFSGRSIIKQIDDIDNSGFGNLIIYSSSLDYGTEGASPENFEVMVFGLHIPGNYRIYEQNENVIVSLNDFYIDFENVTINDIYVIGKFK
jgi:hypothetical protein